MGINSSQPQAPYQISLNTEYHSSHHTPTFISSVATHYRPLSEFRGKLSFRQCTYTFATLYQQYSELIKRSQSIIISDQYCKVNTFGEITVSVVVDSDQILGEKKYDYLLDKLFEIVNNLSFEREWSRDKSVLKLKLKVKHLISVFENQQLLHNKILEQFQQLFQKAKNQCNLISLIYRQKQYPKSRFAFQDSFKENKNNGHMSFANISVFSSSFIDNMGMVSNRNQQKERLSILSNFHPKSRVSENSETLSYYQNLKFQDSFQKQSFRTQKKRNKKCNNRLYITPQFSINIISNPNIKPKSNNQILKVKRDRFRTQTLGSSQSPQKEQLKLAKNRTAVQLNDKKMLKYQRVSKNTPKSVLDTMARLVEVQDLSSSKSYIF